jgi:hypothetical protein
MRNFNLDNFIHGHMVAALWSSHGPEDKPYACENLDDLFGIDDISPECASAMRSVCADFAKSNHADLIAYCDRIHRIDDSSPEDWAGHDFWLTRNGHGAGFWDRGMGALGDRLSKAAKVYSRVDLYPGDDGLIYGETE